MLLSSGIELINPAFHVRLHHLHRGMSRAYKGNDAVGGEIHLVPISGEFLVDEEFV